jgi:Signal transduction histidine kinase
LKGAGTPIVDRFEAALDGERTDRRVGVGGRTLRVHIVPLQGEAEAKGLLLAQDVTEEVRREREIVAAKETAEAANEMKSALMANMGHEIRTPLTSILGFAEVIGEETDPDGTVAHFAGLIEKGGHRLLNTLDSVLNLSKLEDGSRTLAEEPVDLSAEAASVVEELQAAADEKDIALSIDASAEGVQARADAGVVQLVARNLVKNAIKYTEGGGTVEVRVRDDGNAATLAVEDTGIGISEEALSHIFEPFRQESEGFGREYEGSGSA